MRQKWLLWVRCCSSLRHQAACPSCMTTIERTVLPARFPLSKWALLLNELTPELRAKLPPTDDRLRPDMRLFEHGFFHEVSGCGPVGCRPSLRSSGVKSMHSASSI